MEVIILGTLIPVIIHATLIFYALSKQNGDHFAYLAPRVSAIITRLEELECAPRKLTTQEVEKLFNQLLEDQKHLPK